MPRSTKQHPLNVSGRLSQGLYEAAGETRDPVPPLKPFRDENTQYADTRRKLRNGARILPAGWRV